MASMASTKVYLQLQVQYHLKLADKRLLQQAGRSSLHTILPYGTCRLQTIASKHTCNSRDIHARHTSMEGGEHSAKQQYRHMSVCGFNVQQCISTNVETHTTHLQTHHTPHTHTHTQHSQTQTNTVTQNVCHTHIHAHTHTHKVCHRVTDTYAGAWSSMMAPRATPPDAMTKILTTVHGCAWLIGSSLWTPNDPNLHCPARPAVRR